MVATSSCTSPPVREPSAVYRYYDRRLDRFLTKAVSSLAEMTNAWRSTHLIESLADIVAACQQGRELAAQPIRERVPSQA